MKKALLPALIWLGALAANAQAPATPTQPFGKIDKADLELKSCDFEKDANAMVLFDKADVYYDQQFQIVMERHRRIKIFNDNGKDNANVRLEFLSNNHYEYITGLQAQTINLNDKGEVEITKLDKKVLYTEAVDKNYTAYVFTFPNVKPGSVIEYKYVLTKGSYYDMPDWFFQSKIPTRYSEVKTAVPEYFYFRVQSRVHDAFAVNKSTSESKSIGGGTDALNYTDEVNIRALANVHSLPEEPYMRSLTDNLEGLTYHLTSFRPPAGFVQTADDSWDKIGGRIIDNEDFGGQLKRKLVGEEAIIAKAKAMKTNDEKIAYIFGEVKNTMKWDGVDHWYTNDGTVKAWEKKSGNSTEINIILYHLLKQSGVNAYPMVVSTRSHGIINPAYAYVYQFNRGVVYVPVDSTKRYVLDATNKYNTYTDIPDDLLNSTGLWVDKENKKYGTPLLTKKTPVMQLVSVTADVTPEGKINGTAQINSYSYNRIRDLSKYKTDGEQKYIEYLRNSDNTLKIASLKFENMETDSLPLQENLEFKKELTGSDGNYIYFVPSMFIPMRSNPFMSESRQSDIDFGYRNNYSMTGTYKLPAGYKPETLPKNMAIGMPDQSIIFRRVVAEQDGNLLVRYSVDYKKPLFFKENYMDLHEFYKKMSELINEQIVLKKS